MGVRQSELRRLDMLEADYLRILIGALKDCARGAWGLLNDFYDDDKAIARWRPAAVADLLDRGQDIGRLRIRCGMSPFEPHERLLHERAQRGENLPGEPRRAAAWLAALEIADG